MVNRPPIRILQNSSNSESTILLFPFLADVLLGLDSVFPFPLLEKGAIVPSVGRTSDPEEEADTCRRSLLPSLQRAIPDFKAGRMRLSMSVGTIFYNTLPLTLW